MPQSMLSIIAGTPAIGMPATGMPAGRITRPTLAKATVTGVIRASGVPLDSEQCEGWVSWVRLNRIHCYDCAS